MGCNEALKSFRSPKSFFFCLKLQTGCCILGALYWIFGVYAFYKELQFSIEMFRQERDDGMKTLLIYDEFPSLIIFICSSLFYGLYTQKSLFVFPSMFLFMIAIGEDVLHLIDHIVRYLLGYVDKFHISILFLIVAAFNGYSLIIFYAHLKELKLLKRLDLSFGNLSTTEVENLESE